MKYLELNDITSYKKAFILSNYVWEIISVWKFFEKETVGVQFVRSIDSISANIAEGFGRFNKKDKVKFYYYALGSAKESLDWNEKSRIRKLISESQYKKIFFELESLPKEIHQLIKFTIIKLKQ